MYGETAELMVKIRHVHYAVCVELLRTFHYFIASFFKLIKRTLYRVGGNGDMPVRAVEGLFIISI